MIGHDTAEKKKSETEKVQVAGGLSAKRSFKGLYFPSKSPLPSGAAHLI